MIPITYTSRHNEVYAEGLWACRTHGKLRQFVEDWAVLAPDAYQAVWQHNEDGGPMTSKQFQEFRRGLRLEHAKTYAGDEWSERYSVIVMPDLLFRVSMFAERFKVPWGLAFIRLEQEGFIVKQGDVYIFQGDKNDARNVER